MLTIVTLLQNHSTHLSSQPAYYYLNEHDSEDSIITYSALNKKANDIAAYLHDKKLFSKRVLLLYPAGFDFITAFMGCLYAGVIAVPMLAPNTEDLIASISMDADISGVFTISSLMENVKTLFEKYKFKNDLFIVDTNSLHRDTRNNVDLPKIQADTIAYLQYTSGSTSAPKGVITQHKQLMHSLKQTAKAWAYSKDSVTLTWAPHSHVYGLVCGLLLPLYHGTPSIIMSPETFVKQPARWLKALSKYKVTHSGGPNFAFDLCIRDIQRSELDGVDLSRWKFAINGGENVNLETIENFSKLFSEYGFHRNHFTPTYGMSELTGAIAVNGKLLSGLHAVIVNPETLLPVSGDETGEIWLAGKSLASGYWQREEETKQVFNAKLSNSHHHYFRTGDLGFISNHEMHLTGRLKDLIVLNGKKYYPSDFENTVTKAIKDYPVGQYNVVFSKSVDNQEKVYLIQEINPEISQKIQYEMIQVIHHAIFKEHQISLHDIILVKEKTLPKTTSGKLQRKLCKIQFEEGTLSVIKTKVNNNPSDFIKLVASVINKQVNEIDLSKPLSQYGFDSIHLIKLTALLNETYQLDITPAILFEYATLAEFVHHFFDKHANAIHANDQTPQPIANTNDIAIIGMSGLFPNAKDIETFWDNMIARQHAIKEIPSERWDTNKTSIKWGGFIDGIAEFDADFFNISPREAELIDPQQRLFLQTAWKAIEDAGYNTDTLSQLKTGLFVGAFTHDYAELLQKNQITDPYITTGLTHSILANRVSYLLNLHGPSEAIDTACSSSLVAIHHAVTAILHGDCDVAIAGGVNALLSPTSYLSAGKAGMLSEDGSCKTFDKKANGYVRGEGVAALLLKPLKKALTDGDHIYGVIKGTAVNHGGHVSSLTVPNPNAQADVILSACNRAKIPFESISYIEAHGTGTSLGDPIEINGLKKAFSLLKDDNKQNHYFCGIGSVKTHIGHLEAAAGVAGVIKVLLAMQHKKIPGNLHFEEQNPYIELDNSPFYLVNKTIDWTASPRRAGVSSFGFGGTNAHIIIEENTFVTSKNNHSDQHPYLITLSAKTKYSLQKRIQDLQEWLNKQEIKPCLSAISYTLNTGRNHFSERFMVVVSSIEALKTVLKNHGGEASNFSQPIDFNDKNLATASANALLDEKNSLNDAEKLFILGKFYLQGADINWEKLFYFNPKRIPLPTYPFEKNTYWIPLHEAHQTEKIVIKEQKTVPVTASLSSIQHDIIQFVSAILKVIPEKINLTTSLSDQGFDSISFGELAVDLEKHYNIELKPMIFYSYHSIENLSKYLSDTYQVNVEETKPTSPVLTKTLSNSSEPIAIIGMQGLFPQSTNKNAFWDHLQNGRDLITEVPIDRWDWRDYKTTSKWGGFIPNIDQFDASFFNISTREANLMDPQQRLLMEIAWQTIEDAGYDPLSLSDTETGLFVGVGFTDYQSLISKQNRIYHGHVATGNAYAMLANRISYFLNLHGPSEVIDTACSSSLVAINRAVSALQNGECSLAIASGVSIILNPDIFVITSQLGALSPDGRCKTFDKSANGFVKGEGVAAILLKPLSEAQKDGDHIYAVIAGSAVNHGGKAQSLTAPNAEAQSQLLIKAYKKANIRPETVSYIEAHGTGTELGDPIEIEGLKKSFHQLGVDENAKYFCGLGSVKSNIGHLEPASGIAGVMKVLLAMQHKTIPGNLHIHEVNPFIDLTDSPFYLVNKTEVWHRLKDANGHDIPRRAGVSSFGFGGTNAHVILEEYIHEEKNTASKPYYLLTLSAKNEASLKQKIVDLSDWLAKHADTADIESICFTLNIGRTHFDYRCAMVIDSLAELQTTLNALIHHHPVTHCVMNSESLSHLYQPLLKEIYLSSLEAIKHPKKITTEVYKEKLLLLGDLYTRQFPFDLNDIHAGEKRQRVANLPAYPFIKQRYWFDAELETTSIQPILTNDTKIDLLDYLKKIFAEKLQLSPDQLSENETYEMFGVDSLIGMEITTRLEQDFGTLPKTLLYEKNRLIDLANALQQKKSNVLQPLSPATIKEPAISDDIAIIGLTGTYPKANTVDEFWNNLINSKDCITEIPIERWNYKDYPVTVGGEEKYYPYGGFIADADKFDPLFFNISPHDAGLMDPQERLFLQSAWETLEDAGYTRETLEQTVNNNVGVFVGVTFNYYPLFIAEEWSKGNRLPLDLQLFSVANRVSYFLNLNGPSYVIDTACSSSLAAIHFACESILRGECEMAIAGGVNLSLHPSKYHMLGSYSFMSDNGQCASFAANGAGYVPSEGVGSVLLKPLSRAIQDNDHIYGVIKSSHINHGGKTSGYTVPNPNAQAELIKKTLSKSNIHPRSISYIEAHGTGTVLGDPIEISGLQNAFEAYTKDKQFCAIGSVKSNIGHLESAAGISQLTKVLMQMKHKKLVPSIHAEKLNPYIDFSQTAFYVQRELNDWQPENNDIRRAGISSFGAGGTNVHLIVDEYISPPKKMNSSSNHPLIFLLSALNDDRLAVYAQKMHAYLQNTNEQISDVCYTLQVGREHMRARLAIKADSHIDLLHQLKSYIEKSYTPPFDNNIQSWLNGENVEWEKLYSGELPKRISLPTYPFAKRRCWITSHEPIVQHQERWLIFSDMELGFHLQTEFGKSSCIYCFAGETFEKMNDHVFYINPEQLEDYKQLMQHPIKGIIYLWPIVKENIDCLFQVISDHQLSNCLFSIITRDDEVADQSKNANTFYIRLNDNDSLHEQAQFIVQKIHQFKPNENSVSNNQTVFECLLTLLSQLLELDINEIEGQTPFLNYGLDSIMGVNFVAELDKHYPGLITPMDLYRYPTLDQLVDYISASTESVAILDIPAFIDNEQQFLNDIAHLSDKEVSQLLEKELMELDNVC